VVKELVNSLGIVSVLADGEVHGKWVRIQEVGRKWFSRNEKQKGAGGSR
jgi:hypothetical protein